jgi:hypothetical protein
LGVEFRVDQQLVSALGLLIAGKKRVVMVDTYLTMFDLEGNHPANYLMGDHIAVAVVGKLAVLVNLAKHLDGGVIRDRW